jgi:protein-histidine N-methyltransferase
MSKLQRAEGDMSRLDGQALRHLTEWLEAKGARFSSLCLCTYDDGERGAHARAPLQKGQIVLEMPLRLILTEQVAWGSAIGRQLEASGMTRLSSHSYLAACMLQEKYAPDSFWAPYIATLPVSFPQGPLFFTPADLALLEGSFLLTKIDKRRSALAEEYQSLCRCVPGFDRFTWEEFLWAHAIASSRCFRMEIHGSKTAGLVPMADMLNHRHPEETGWRYDDGADGFVLTARQGFAPGEPVHDSYGRRCNSEFFMHYGFCLEENEDNRAQIRFADRTLRVPASLDHKSTRKLLSFLRLTCASSDDALSPARDAEEEIGPISLANETRSLLALAAACTEALRRFPTSLEEDEALLQDHALTRNARNSILMRRGEKRVLRYFLALAEVAVPWLRRPWSEVERAAAESRYGAGSFDDYLSVVVSLKSANLSLRARQPASKDEP